MTVNDWKRRLAEDGALTLQLAGLEATLFRLENGAELALPQEGDGLTAVLQGECDLLLGGGRYRLDTGAWANLPAGVTGRIHVFRSTVPCALLSVRAAGTARTAAMGNAFDLPARDGAAYFGLECAGMTGCLCREGGTPEGWLGFPVERDGQSGLLCVGLGKAGGDYIQWLRQTWGILWEQGVREAAALGNW